MKHLSKIFLITSILLTQLNVVFSRPRGRGARRPAVSAPAKTIVSSATIAATLEIEIGKLNKVKLDPTYRKIIKRAMDQIDKIDATNVSGITKLKAFVSKAIETGADNGIDDDANRIITTTKKTNEKTLTDLAKKLYEKKSIIGEANAKTYVKNIYAGILSEQQKEIPGKGSTKSFKDFIIKMAQILKTIPGYYSELTPAVQNFIDYANAKGQESATKKTTNRNTIKSIITLSKNSDLSENYINGPSKFTGKLLEESPGTKILQQIEALNNAGTDPNYRKAIYPFITETLVGITSEAIFAVQRTIIKKFVDTAIDKGAGDAISADNNKVFRKSATSKQKSLTDLAISLASKPYTKELFATVVFNILEQQEGNIPGRLGQFVTFVNNLKTHVLIKVPSLANDAEISEKLQLFVTKAKEKVYGQNDRKTALQSFVTELKKHGYTNLVY